MMATKYSRGDKKRHALNRPIPAPDLSGRILDLLFGAISAVLRMLSKGPHVLILSLVLGGMWAVMSGVSLWAIPQLSGMPNSLSPFDLIFFAPYGAAVGAICSPFAICFLRRKAFWAIAKVLFVLVTPCVLMIPVLVNFLSMRYISPLDDVLVILAGSAACFIGASAIAKTLLPDIEESLDSCDTCGYNLTGNLSGICPECGEPCDSDASAT